MTEKAIEMRLAAAVRSYGGVAVKLAATGISGMPDRLLLLPGGRMAFVETKAPGKKPRAKEAESVAGTEDADAGEARIPLLRDRLRREDQGGS